MTANTRWSYCRRAMLLACGLTLLSCYDSTSPRTSGNSNWLTTCASDASCGAFASCLCGVCTRVCDRGAECGAAREHVRCVDPALGEVGNGCALQVAPAHVGICLSTCSSDSECGAGQWCEDGSCVARTTISSEEPVTAPQPAMEPLGTRCDPTREGCSSDNALRVVIEQSRNATTPADPNARVWSCEAGAVRVDPAGYDEAFAIAIAGDALLIAGATTAERNGAWRVERRLLRDLSPAFDFGTRGVVTSGGTPRWDAASALAADSDYLYVAGVDGYDMPAGGRVNLEKRALASGALVSDFGLGGTVELEFGGAPAQPAPQRAMGRAFAIDGTHAYVGGTAFHVEKRTLGDGTLAGEFGEGGIGLSSASPDSVASSAVVQDGTLYMAGAEGFEDLRLEARNASSGALLYAVTQDFDDVGCEPQCVALAAGEDNALYLAATAAGAWRIERRERSRGTLVYEKQLAASGNCDMAGAVVVDGDAMYVAGTFDGGWRIEKRALADGELLDGFGDGGAVEPGLRGAASAIALQGDVLYVAGLEGPRAGLQSSVWRIERRSAKDGALLPCPAGSPAVPRAPECGGTPTLAGTPTFAGKPLPAVPDCEVRLASSNACTAVNVRASTRASAVEDWVLPEGGALPDDSLTSVELLDEPSSFLLLRGFGFALPDSVRVLGIAVDATRVSPEPGAITDHAVRLVKGGLILDADHSLSGAWGTGVSEATYGGPTDIWDSSWAPGDINDTSFGVGLRVRTAAGTPDGKAQYDAVRVHVYYCE